MYVIPRRPGYVGLMPFYSSRMHSLNAHGIAGCTIGVSRMENRRDQFHVNPGYAPWVLQVNTLLVYSDGNVYGVEYANFQEFWAGVVGPDHCEQHQDYLSIEVPADPYVRQLPIRSRYVSR